ncbi:MAG TPA: transglutaminase domain-containing protein [Woeseiaceae bacterium]|nr:transglutaminase domain-containing protein [Woeseiaceae bacterium]
MLLVSQLLAAAPAMPVDRVAEAVDAGQFQAAEAMITGALADPGVSKTRRDAFLFQRERMRRILIDFSLTAEDVKERLRRQIPDLTDEEFARWDEHGLLERQLIDGRVLYFNRSPSNLFRLSAEARARREVQTPLKDGPMETLNAHHFEVRQAALTQETAGVLPQRIRVTQSLSVDADAVPEGETVRAWIPLPRVLPGRQEDFRILRSEPASREVAPEDVMQRTVYFEKPAVANAPTEFSVTYELTVLAQYTEINPDEVMPAPATPALAPFVAERPPHIVFNKSLRLFSEQIVGAEENPWRIAQKLFAAVDEIPWAGAREYSTITNISDYALHAGHADCGQQTLLLIALLRMNGIPARWQSGMVYSDGDYGKYWNLHDWGLFYLEPYGWLPMDVTFGRFADANEMEWFYLGGLDAYRIAFNDDFGTDFAPPKHHFRSETVDSQRGEAEWDGGNLYFDQWDYEFDAQLVMPANPSVPAGSNY